MTDLQTGKRVLLIDDDLMSREVLTLILADAGFVVTPVSSGEEAMEELGSAHPMPAARPAVVLTDMQMPGLSGDSLARLLRASCPESLLLCMSGSRPSVAALEGFDGFLLKPFTVNEFRDALEGVTRIQPETVNDQALNQTIYDNLAQGMPPGQLRPLYDMCLDDADRRIEAMRTAVKAGDEDAFVRGAHAIKGGCGMVGATELANMASAMETDGLPPVGNQAPLERLDQFLAASKRLRRILDAQPSGSTGSMQASAQVP